jgi:putative ATPase
VSLFDLQAPAIDPTAPLAHRMRPRSLDEYVGQEQFIGEGKLLWRVLKADRLMSVIFYGPPGTGKTALARIIATETKAHFEELNAAGSKVADVKQALTDAENRKEIGERTVLFIDEIHRFNRAQQDVLLPGVEKGLVTLVGATTHNPFFSINSALISRSQLFQFEPLSTEHLVEIMQRALEDEERGFGDRKIHAVRQALEHLADVSDGDARRALNGLEVAILTSDPDADDILHLDLQTVEECIQRKAVVYDKSEDSHYDVASAFIKSMRGSDPDAALYWLARMLDAGEDIRFIARRIVICASEDVGNAAPYALVIANAALQVAEYIGMPEAQIPLAQAVTYVATCPKSNSAVLAIGKAMKAVKEGRVLEVPEHLKDAHYAGAKKLGHGKDYQYSHDFEGHYVPQDYLTEDLIFYEPSDQGHERDIKKRLEEWRRLKRESRKKNDSTHR